MAAYTLFDIAYRVARELSIVHEGTATSGSTTTTVDNIFLKDRFPDDHFKAGTIFIIYVASHVPFPPHAPPEREWARITDFAESTGMVTHVALTAAVGAGDRYAVCNPEYTIDTIIQNTNAILSELEIPNVDISTIDTAENTTEYTLPTGVLDQNVKVWIQRSTVTNQNLWIEYHDWYIAETVTGTAKKLIFRHQPPEPWDVKLEYWLPHPALYLNTEKLAESLNINRIVAEAALKCLLWKKAQKAQDDPILDQRITELMGRVVILRSKYPNKKPEIKLANYGLTNNFD
jgi:hypothetical protein